MPFCNEKRIVGKRALADRTVHVHWPSLMYAMAKQHRNAVLVNAVNGSLKVVKLDKCKAQILDNAM